MPAYNFQTCFAPLVASGEKCQTIRAIGKRRHAGPGDHLQLYTGMRTKVCRKLEDPDPVCTAVREVFLSAGLGCPPVQIEGLPAPNPDAFARVDGFADFYDMLDYFREAHGLPFHGLLITW